METRIRALRLAGIWLVLACAYVLFVGSLGVNECLAGSVGAGLATAWDVLAARRGGLRFRLDGQALRPLAASLRALPGRTLRTGVTLGRAVAGGRPGGSLRRPPASDSGWARADGPSALAVRAIGLLAASLAPDRYVVRVDPHGGVTAHVLGADEMGEEASEVRAA